MLTKGAKIPTRLQRYSGLAVCQYNFTPPALHPGRTCRVHNSGKTPRNGPKTRKTRLFDAKTQFSGLKHHNRTK